MFTQYETVRFRHVDFAGIVFYPRFLEMLNDLVEDWFAQALDRPFSRIHQTHGIPTVDLKVKFKNAARIGDELEKSLWVQALGGSSVTCGFRFGKSGGATCLEGEVTLVNVARDKDSGSIKSEPFDDATREKIAQYLKS